MIYTKHFFATIIVILFYRGLWDVFKCTFGKAVRSCCGGKSVRTSDNNAVCAAAMDNLEIAVCSHATDVSDVGIIGIEHQIARLRITPCDVRAIAVLRRNSAAAPRIIAAAELRCRMSNRRIHCNPVQTGTPCRWSRCLRPRPLPAFPGDLPSRETALGVGLVGVSNRQSGAPALGRVG